MSLRSIDITGPEGAGHRKVKGMKEKPENRLVHRAKSTKIESSIHRKEGERERRSANEKEKVRENWRRKKRKGNKEKEL